MLRAEVGVQPIDVDTDADGAVVDRLEDNPLVFAVRSSRTDSYGVVRKGRQRLRCMTCSRPSCEHTAALAAVASRDGFQSALLPNTGDDGLVNEDDHPPVSATISQQQIHFPITAIPDPAQLGDCLFASPNLPSDSCVHGNPWNLLMDNLALICDGEY